MMVANAAERLVLISKGENHRIATWYGHVLASFSGRPDVASAQLLAREVAKAAKALPGRAAYFARLESGLELPSSDVREVYARLGRVIAGEVNSIAVAIEGTGFAVSATRAMVTGLGIAAGVRVPLRAFASIAEAGNWAGPRIIEAGGVFRGTGEVVERFGELARA